MKGEVHHDRRLHVLMLREEEMQWEHGHSKPRYHMRWNHSLGEAATSATSPTDSAGSMHAEYMNLPDADGDQLSQFRSESCPLLLHHAQQALKEAVDRRALHLHWQLHSLDRLETCGLSCYCSWECGLHTAPSCNKWPCLSPMCSV